MSEENLRTRLWLLFKGREYRQRREYVLIRRKQGRSMRILDKHIAAMWGKEMERSLLAGPIFGERNTNGTISVTRIGVVND